MFGFTINACGPHCFSILTLLKFWDLVVLFNLTSKQYTLLYKSKNYNLSSVIFNNWYEFNESGNLTSSLNDLLVNTKLLVSLKHYLLADDPTIFLILKSILATLNVWISYVLSYIWVYNPYTVNYLLSITYLTYLESPLTPINLNDLVFKSNTL